MRGATRQLLLLTSIAAMLGAGAPLPAQQGPTHVPPGHAPPPGMCRIWLPGVPPGRQPAPTDCATAERNRPANARVLYGASSAGTVERFARHYPRTSSGSAPMPGGWPTFNDAVLFERGARPGSVAQWAPGATRVVFSDYRASAPTTVRFYDAAGRLLAVWYDRDLDGRVEAAQLYRDGRLAGTYTR